MAYAKKRTPSKAKRSTWPKGDWREQLRQRLVRLARDAGSNNKFASAIELNPRRVGSWLNAEVLPGADNLRTIAEKLDLSLDWLIFGTDASGNPTPEPQYRGQSRDKKTLEDDLAAAVLRELHAEGLALPPVSLDIYPPRLFKEVVQMVKREFESWLSSAADDEILSEAITALTEALSTPGATRAKKAEWKAARLALMQRIENRKVR